MYELARLLGVDEARAHWHLCCFEVWVSGLRSRAEIRVPERAVAQGSRWFGEPTTFVGGLVAAGWIVPKAYGWLAQDWWNRHERWYEITERNAQRQREFRERRAIERGERRAQPSADPENAPGNGNVTRDVTPEKPSRNARTIQDHPGPDRTGPTKDGGGGGVNDKRPLRKRQPPPPGDTAVSSSVALEKAARLEADRHWQRLRAEYGDPWVDHAISLAIQRGRVDTRGSPVLAYVEATLRGWREDGFSPPDSRPWEHSRRGEGTHAQTGVQGARVNRREQATDAAPGVFAKYGRSEDET